MELSLVVVGCWSAAVGDGSHSPIVIFDNFITVIYCWVVQKYFVRLRVGAGNQILGGPDR